MPREIHVAVLKCGCRQTYYLTGRQIRLGRLFQCADTGHSVSKWGPVWKLFRDVVSVGAKRRRA